MRLDFRGPIQHVSMKILNEVMISSGVLRLRRRCTFSKSTIETSENWDAAALSWMAKGYSDIGAGSPPYVAVHMATGVAVFPSAPQRVS